MIVNAVRYAAFNGNDAVKSFYSANTEPLEKLTLKAYTVDPIQHPKR